MAIGFVLAQAPAADLVVLDEPSSYLDVGQRLAAASAVRAAASAHGCHVVAVEHDLALVDFLADRVCCLYGSPGAYGVVTAPGSAARAVNSYLGGFLPADNVRFREEALSFDGAWSSSVVDDDNAVRGAAAAHHRYPAMTKTLENFR